MPKVSARARYRTAIGRSDNAHREFERQPAHALGNVGTHQARIEVERTVITVDRQHTGANRGR
jgi:hypothetical protein